MSKPRDRKTAGDDEDDDDEGLGEELDDMDLDGDGDEGRARLKYLKKLVRPCLLWRDLSARRRV